MPRRATDSELLTKLGYKPDDKLLILHADDLGMCRSVNAASIAALTKGVVSSASVMVPCPWFPAMAAWAKTNPDADLGLHLTLTSEWQHYRWRPVASIDKVKGLLDQDGFMHRKVEDVVKRASPQEVEIEVRAQIERALHFGMKPTHLDSHMGTLFADPRFFEVYVKLGREYRIMPMLMEDTPETLLMAAALGIDYKPIHKRLKEQKFVMIDRLHTGENGADEADRKRKFDAYLAALKPGVSEIIVHLSGDEAEIREITGNWRNRFIEGRVCVDPEMRQMIDRHGVKLIGYRELARAWAV